MHERHRSVVIARIKSAWGWVHGTYSWKRCACCNAPWQSHPMVSPPDSIWRWVQKDSRATNSVWIPCNSARYALVESGGPDTWVTPEKREEGEAAGSARIHAAVAREGYRWGIYDPSQTPMADEFRMALSSSDQSDGEEVRSRDGSSIGVSGVW